jgi:hypothetical protein
LIILLDVNTILKEGGYKSWTMNWKKF